MFLSKNRLLVVSVTAQDTLKEVDRHLLTIGLSTWPGLLGSVIFERDS